MIRSFFLIHRNFAVRNHALSLLKKRLSDYIIAVNVTLKVLNNYEQEIFMINIAFLGAGGIAIKMANTLNGMKENGKRFSCYAVAARDLERAQTFANEHGFAKAYGSYEEMLSDEKVDLVYIATPHSHHYGHIKMCLEHGRHVLCEKAFTVNATQAEEVLAMAREKGLLLAEAIWTRYMPARQMINDILASGEIGAPCILTANLCYNIEHKERLNSPHLAGGALLDVGIYPLNFAVMAFGHDIVKVDSSVQMLDTGVDRQESITLHFADGRMAILNASIAGIGDRKGVIYGKDGYLEVENINNPEMITVYRDYEPVKSISCPEQISGYEYEVLSCLNAIENGRTQCPEMPHEDTVRMLKLMDEIRSQWRLAYPCE